LLGTLKLNLSEKTGFSLVTYSGYSVNQSVGNPSLNANNQTEYVTSESPTSLVSTSGIITSNQTLLTKTIKF